jgi:hypothetical protein
MGKKYHKQIVTTRSICTIEESIRMELISNTDFTANSYNRFYDEKNSE